MNKNIWKRITSFLLALVLVLTVVPVQAKAAEPSVSDQGFTLTLIGMKYDGATQNSLRFYGPMLFVTNNGGGEYSFTFYGSVYGDGNNSIAFKDGLEGSFQWDDCTKALNHTFTVTGSVISYPATKPYELTFKITKNALGSHSTKEITTTEPTCSSKGLKKTVCSHCAYVQSTEELPIDPTAHNYQYTSLGNDRHQGVCSYNAAHVISEENCSGGTATCSAAAVCQKCKTAYGSKLPHTWTKWTYNASSYVNIGHYRTCTVCNPEGEQGSDTGYEFEIHSYSQATCVQRAKCKCGSEYGGLGSHSYTYTKEGNTIKQVCAYSDKHNSTVSIGKNSEVSTVYTGSEIRALKPVISGAALDVAITYSDNVNVGIAKGTITLGGHTIEETFEITPAAMVLQAADYVGTYDGQPHGLHMDNLPVGSTVYYKTSETGTFSAEPVTRTNVGSTTVWYKVTNPNYHDAAGTATITVTPATIIVTPDEGKSMIYGGEIPELTYAYSGSVGAEIPAFTGTLGISGTNVGAQKITIGTLELVDNGSFKASNYILALDEVGFTVNQADGAAYVTIEGWEYGDTAKEPAPVSPTNGVDNVTYLYKEQGADDSTYTSTVPTEVGNYTVKATFAATNNYKEATAMADFEISKRKVTVTAEDASKTYGDADPEKLTWTVTDGTELSSEPLSINISRTEGENAGDYAITVSQTEGANPNYDITFVNGTFTIHKAPLTIAAENKTATYGDEAPQFTVIGSGFKFTEAFDRLSGTLSFACDYAQFSDKGTYIVTPGGYESDNYEISYVSGTLTVEPKTITVTIASKTSVYGEELAALTADDHGGIVNGDTGVYALETTATSASNVGEYAITGTALDDNYSITFVYGTYTITKATATAVAPTANTLTYKGSEQTLITAGSTNDGSLVYSLEMDGIYTAELPKAIDAGAYYVWYKVIGDENHTDSTPAFVEVEIAKADPGIGAVTADVLFDTLETNAILLTRANTDISGNLTVDAGQSLAWGSNEIRYTFTPDDANYKVVTGTLNVTVADTVAPGAVITLQDHWNQFWNGLTFDMFFNKPQTFTIHTQDAVSGVYETGYYLADAELTLEEVKTIEEWTEYTGPVKVDPDKAFVIYAKVSDKAGNVTYVNSEGIVLDATMPVISGVEDGGIYYGDVTIAVNDTYFDDFSVDGHSEELSNGTYCIKADNREHTVVATDQAGNKTACKITVYKIYTVTFVADGEILVAVQVNHGDDVELPEIPEKEGYTAAWDHDGKNITDHTVITAVYIENPDPVPVTVSFKGQVKLIGRDLIPEEFKFALIEADADYNYAASQSQDLKWNDADGVFVLEPIRPYTEAGIYRYRIEVVKNGEGDPTIDYDATVYQVEVTVTEEDGVLSAQVNYFIDGIPYMDSLLKFVNAYKETGSSGEPAPGDPEEEPTEPGAPGDPEEEPTEPGVPGDPEEEPTEPGVPGDPEEEPTEPGVPGDPEEEPTEPSAPAGAGEGTNNKPADPNHPHTGDDSSSILYGSMFTVSLAGLVVLILIAKKRKQEMHNSN